MHGAVGAVGFAVVVETVEVETIVVETVVGIIGCKPALA